MYVSWNSIQSYTGRYSGMTLAAVVSEISQPPKKNHVRVLLYKVLGVASSEREQ